MLNTIDAERFLDSSSDLELARPKEKYSAVYLTRFGRRYLALERRSKTVAKIHFEPVLDVPALKLSPQTEIEQLSAAVPRVHLPVEYLRGPYNGRSGYPAWRVRLASVGDLQLLVAAYAHSPAR